MFGFFLLLRSGPGFAEVGGMRTDGFEALSKPSQEYHLAASGPVAVPLTSTWTARMDRSLALSPHLRFSQAAAPQAPAPTPGTAAGGAAAQSEHDSLADVGAKLSNPVSDVWALFTEFDLIFSDGDVNTGDPQVGFSMQFQPVLPIPLFGKWKLIVRPTVPVLFSQPVPEGFNDFDHKIGLADTLLPLVLSPPTKNWILALGPTFTIPTSTVDAFGRQQWAMGPAGVLGYKTKKAILGVFPQYFFGIGSRGDQGDTPDASYMSLLYFFFYNLPEAWQVGFNPVISYDNKALPDNKWNVPIGLTVAKTTKIGKLPVKFQFGFEYSVVSQDAFGQRFLLKLNVIPVIPSLIKKPLFGGTS
jgi:hypothetical protein